VTKAAAYELAPVRFNVVCPAPSTRRCPASSWSVWTWRARHGPSTNSPPQARPVVAAKQAAEISAILADPQQASLLETNVGSPLIQVTRLFYAQDGHPIYHLQSVAVPERTRFLMEIPASAINTLSAGSYQHSVDR
jgi:hypothetical protein